MEINRICIIGNAGAGKTTLSRALKVHHRLPLTHVDSIQFLPNMKIRPHHESIQRLEMIQNQHQWIIEGYGPLDIIEDRFKLADRVIFIDFALWRHYWWSTKRQLRNAGSRREELPEGCDEFTIAQTLKLFSTIKKVHEKMRPQILKILARADLQTKTIHIKTYSQWKQIFNQGIQ